VLSGRGLCDELITRPEESFRLWCFVVCDLENVKNEEAMTRVGSQRHSKKKKKKYIYIYSVLRMVFSILIHTDLKTITLLIILYMQSHGCLTENTV